MAVVALSMKVFPSFECVGGEDAVVASVAVVAPSMKVVPSFECVGGEDAVVVLEGGVGDGAVFVGRLLLRVSRQTDDHVVDLIPVHLLHRPVPPERQARVNSFDYIGRSRFAITVAKIKVVLFVCVHMYTASKRIEIESPV